MEEQNKNKEAEKIYAAGEVGSLLESINDGIKVVAEDQSSIKKDIKEIKSDIDELKSDVVDIKRDIKEIRGDVVEIRSDIVELKSDVVDIKTELKIMNGKLDGKAEKEVTDNHEKRIVNLEKTALTTM